jgi:hypothetical protein
MLTARTGSVEGACDVRFGSKGDIGRRPGMGLLYPQRADIGDGGCDVGDGPEADMVGFAIRSPRRQLLTPTAESPRRAYWLS